MEMKKIPSSLICMSTTEKHTSTGSRTDGVFENKPTPCTADCSGDRHFVNILSDSRTVFESPPKPSCADYGYFKR